MIKSYSSKSSKQERTIISTDVGEDGLEVLVVGETIQSVLQGDSAVLEAGEDQTVQTRLQQEGHQRLGQHLEDYDAVETAIGVLKSCFLI